MDMEELLKRLTSGDADDGSGGDDAGDAGDADGGEEAPPWAAQIEELRAQNAKLAEAREHDRYTYLAQLSELKGALGSISSATPAPAPKPEEFDMNEAIRLIPQNPELLPAIIEKLVEQKTASLRGSIKDELTGDLGRDRADAELRNLIGLHYADDIRPGSKSPLLGKTVEMRELLRPFLDKKYHGSEQENRLAFLLAGASQPDVQAERVASRKAEESRRDEEMIRRLSALSGSGRLASHSSPVDRVTQDDESVARVLGIDLSTEEAKAKLLRYKKKSADNGGLALLVNGRQIGRA